MGRTGQWVRFVVVVVAYGLSLVLYVRAVPDGLLSPGFVFVAMVCFLGLAFVARPIAPIRVPRMLRTVRAWEVRGRLYRAVGVRAFGTLLRRTPLRLLNISVYLREARSPAALAAELEAAEASHLWDGILVLPYMVYAGTQGAWGTVLWFCVAQLLINAYPIAHLRLARHRLLRLARRGGKNPFGRNFTFLH